MNNAVSADTKAKRSTRARLALVGSGGSFVDQRSPPSRRPRMGTEHWAQLSLTKRVFFESSAVEAARKELLRIEHDTGVATVIETVASLKGTPIAEAAGMAARKSGIHGIFVLIAKNEHEIEILVSKQVPRGADRTSTAADPGRLYRGLQASVILTRA